MKKCHGVRLAVIVLCTVLCLPLSACGSSAQVQRIAKPRLAISKTDAELPFSRVKLYGSLQEMVDNSSDVVAGIITSQEVKEEGQPGNYVTLSKVQVLDSLKGEKKPGDTIIVNQDGTEKINVGVILVKKDEVVLLFLHKMYTGDARDLPWKGQYSVSGVWAGIYSLSKVSDFTTLAFIEKNEGDRKQNEKNVHFTRFIISDSDQLPETVSLSEVREMA